jgi:serine-type D-Ala-D-Ala endopeptidase (penicillin-binding protein 7)
MNKGRRFSMRLAQLFTVSALIFALALSGYSSVAEAADKTKKATSSKHAKSKSRVKTVYARGGKHSAGRGNTNHYIVTNNGELRLASSAALVIDQEDGHTVYSKRADAISPIASITKLMTAMVVLDAQLPMDEQISVDSSDVDTLRNSSSRLAVGATLPRSEMLRLALMSSENRAAAALARTYPGGTPAFVSAMNRKAAQLGMQSSHFVDSTGLHSENVSTPEDLAKMVGAGTSYGLIREFTTTASADVEIPGRRSLEFRNTNALVRSKEWDIGLSKTGYISEAGRCLVMQATIASRPMIIVLLDSVGKYARIADAQRIKRWVELRGGRVAGAAKPLRNA